MRKKFSMFLAGLLLSAIPVAMPCTASAARDMENSNHIICDEMTDWDKLVIVSDEQLHFMYTQNSDLSDAVGQLSQGTAAEIVGENGDWYFVRSGIYKGFMKKSGGLISGEKAESYAMQHFKKQASVTENTVYVHGWSEKTGKMPYVVGVLAKEDVVQLGEQVSEGYLVSTCGVQGIVNDTDVTMSVILDGAVEPDISDLTNQSDDMLGSYDDAKTYDYAQNLVPRDEDCEGASDHGDAFQMVVDYAKLFLGNPYVWGGESLTEGVDCSGFIMKVYEHFGISLPHSSFLMRTCGESVSEGYFDVEISLPGDIVCYDGHVALYMGDGKIIHAANRKDGIKISDVDYRSDLICVRRLCIGHGIWGDVTDAEFDALCRIVETEAGSCSLQEKIYVADVILNRVCSSRFSENTIIGVITAPGQFQPVTNGRWQTASPKAESIYATRYALSHNDSSMGALFFMNPKLSDPDNVTWFRNSLEYLFMIDNTAFFR